VEVLVPDQFRTRHVTHRDRYLVEPRVRAMGADLELLARRKDGTEFPVEISLSPLLTPKGTLVSAAIRDITDRRAAEEAMREALEREQEAAAQLRELDALKDEFLATVSHELRTPLTSIQGYIKTLLQLGGDLDPEQRETFLQAADRQGERLRRLIEQTLIVARLESHVEPIVVTEVSVSSLLSVIVQELEPVAHGHAFDVRVPPEVKPVRTDEGKVHQILSNLVENALKYSPPDTRVIVRADEGVGGILVAVEDEGPGIEADEQNRVFDRFYQVDQTATRKVGGTGLGLYICRKLAEEIGARLWLERSQPEGSVFCLFVPWTPPERSGDDPLDEPGQSITASV
jgi:protein-histidine pros-kinase